PAVEEALTGTDAGTAALDAAASAALAGLTPADDVHATAAYRRETAAHLLVRACTLAWERCS
ncbi:xanthine dehydrogenase family protein subunit M, partial [Streptomyces sp. NPDC056983]